MQKQIRTKLGDVCRVLYSHHQKSCRLSRISFSMDFENHCDKSSKTNSEFTDLWLNKVVSVSCYGFTTLILQVQSAKNRRDNRTFDANCTLMMMVTVWLSRDTDQSVSHLFNLTLFLVISPPLSTNLFIILSLCPPILHPFSNQSINPSIKRMT